MLRTICLTVDDFIGAEVHRACASDRATPRAPADRAATVRGMSGVAVTLWLRVPGAWRDGTADRRVREGSSALAQRYTIMTVMVYR